MILVNPVVQFILRSPVPVLSSTMDLLYDTEQVPALVCPSLGHRHLCYLSVKQSRAEIITFPALWS